jgi:hypothetical protein
VVVAIATHAIVERFSGKGPVNVSTRQAVIQRELALEQGEDSGSVLTDYPHVYDGERCVNCKVNVYDNDIYGPFECKSHEPMQYTTSTGDPSVFDTDPARWAEEI